MTSSFFIHLDVVMIGALLPQAEFIGFYQVASTIAISLAALITVANVSLPVFSQLKGKRLQDSFDKFFKYSAILSIPLSIGLPLVAKPFITIIFGQEYSAAILPLYFLSFLIFESATGVFFTVAITAKEKPEYIAKFMIIANALNLILAYALIKNLAHIKPEYGMIGAALAILISRYFYLATLVVTSREKFNLKLRKNLIYKPLFASLIMVLFIISFDFLFSSNIMLKSLEIILASAVYFISLFLIKGLHKKDFETVKYLLRLKNSYS